MNTRGHDLKLYPERTKTNIRKYVFPARIAIWNDLPQNIIEAPTTNTFKNRLDKYWENQELLYNFEAPLTGGGGKTLQEKDMELSKEAAVAACAQKTT